MFLLPIKLDRVSFETKGRQNLQKTADFLIESIVFCPLVPPSWISLVDPTSAMYASAIYVSYIYGRNQSRFQFPSSRRPSARRQNRSRRSWVTKDLGMKYPGSLEPLRNERTAVYLQCLIESWKLRPDAHK